MVAFIIEIESIQLPVCDALPQKNTFIHFDDVDSELELERPSRRQATCPDLVQRRTFRTKTFLARRQQGKLAMHAAGECRPCAYFALKSDGCRLGDDCSYCHLCTRRDIRKWKKAYAVKKLAADSLA
eukprot:TRINITY_DN4406_c0_g1_i1.p1 TRINITY_DN4406_c0_g1~~TRINITY_DN4406_c0_g1_i1.p1  ORF type:complete len:127 (+),score=30.56 TRINITY_DN4406_c0_g1_i1:81-461(+)